VIGSRPLETRGQGGLGGDQRPQGLIQELAGGLHLPGDVAPRGLAAEPLPQAGEGLAQLPVERGVLRGQRVRQFGVLLMQRVRGMGLGERRLPAMSTKTATANRGAADLESLAIACLLPVSA
jgi:hypothetical protein